MKIYQIIGYSEAESQVAFVDVVACPAGVPDVPREALKHCLKWHPTLGKTKFPDVKYLIREIADTAELKSTRGKPQIMTDKGERTTKK